MIHLDALFLAYGAKTVFAQLTLDIPIEGITCISGPSGCGKTTLLRLLAGLETPDRGKITGCPDKIGILFQENRLLPWCTALENVAAVTSRETAAYWLSMVELSPEADVYPAALSGGMCRRVALARALAYDADLLLLDEPFTGLDAALTARLCTLVRGLGKPVIAVTHAAREAELLGGRVLPLFQS